METITVGKQWNLKFLQTMYPKRINIQNILKVLFITKDPR